MEVSEVAEPLVVGNLNQTGGKDMPANLDIFLSQEDRTAIKNAVHEAESTTSGEIVVLVVERSKKLFSFLSAEQAVEKRAEKEFLALGIQQTEDRTGVLIMLSLRERRAVVKADKSINDKVPAGTWEKVVDLAVAGIQQGKAGEGISDAVLETGRILTQHFPIKPGDKNELADDVRTGR